MKPAKSGIAGPPASVVPPGRTCFRAGFPGTSSLANFLCRFATLSNCDREVGGSGKGRLGRRGFTGLNGRNVGKAWNFYRLATGFSHFKTALTSLFPFDSTQVVDFPCMYAVGIFWGEGYYHRGTEAQSRPGGAWNPYVRSSVGVLECVGTMRKVTGWCGKVRDVTRKFTKVRTDQGRNSAMLRIVTGGTFF